jgi:hypothetical protein
MQSISKEFVKTCKDLLAVFPGAEPDRQARTMMNWRVQCFKRLQLSLGLVDNPCTFSPGKEAEYPATSFGYWDLATHGLNLLIREKLKVLGAWTGIGCKIIAGTTHRSGL